MLAYLDALCAALLRRDTDEIDRLLAHPSSERLPQSVREEALAIRDAGQDGFRAPINALHYYYKLTHLLDENCTPSPRRRRASLGAREGSEDSQIELPLEAMSAWM